ncbi:MAG TPA: primosomal protein N' [Nitrospinaceae bacterium]|jgi:primosomal protein N' (replication factor Y)|nr:primosomal protein N' [Nitrospinaceae bacterium]HIL26110.1 primosomal protein N' [Nitrospinaceae bacterium]
MTPPKTYSAKLFTDQKPDFAYAEVVFNLPLKDVFTYEIPPHFRGIVKKGMRVFVPFGRRRLTGYVIGISNHNEKNIKLKKIEEVPDLEPVISKELLSLTRWIADYYHSSWGEAIKAALPAGLDDTSLDKLYLTEQGITAIIEDKQSTLSTYILQTLHSKKSLTSKQLERCLKKKYSPSSLAKLKRDGLVGTGNKIKRSSLRYEYEKNVHLAKNLPKQQEIEKLLKRSPKQRETYEYICRGPITISVLKKKIPGSSQSIKSLLEKKLIETSTRKNEKGSISLDLYTEWTAESPPQLNKEQDICYKKLKRTIENSIFKPFLLHGITGSGKTEIYLRCIQLVLNLNKSAVMVVPEISLTPQTVERFRKRFGNQVAVLHSGLTQKERFIEWKKIRDEKVSIAVGARSAIFAPFKHLGIIVIDEEHDTSYKQDSCPRYHARDSAIVRAQKQNAVVLLGSATPSLESIKNVEKGKYHYLSLKSRVHNRLLPIVKVINMKQEMDLKKNFSIFSIALKKAISERITRREQIFLFLNRRGTAGYVSCKECSFAFECPHCTVTLTFHGKRNFLLCHYCNFTTRKPEFCAECGGPVIRFSGFGTQKLEEEAKKLFPQARIDRLDRDTVKGRESFESVHRKMNSGEIDILIGTQMITKGHDFPNVTLVGVIYADISLNIPDFRSAERSFQLLTQVAGRAGRGKVPGLVIIQSLLANHYVFDFVKEHDFRGFSEKELALREKLKYPPFTRMVSIEIESVYEQAGEIFANSIMKSLARILKGTNGIEVLGPARAALYQINNRFRRHLILRSYDYRKLHSVLNRLYEIPEYKKSSNPKIKLILDVDPINLM